MFLPISIVAAAILISISILSGLGIDFFQKIFSVAGSLSIVVALVTYFYKKRQDKVSAIVDQIAFFREKIMPESEKVNQGIKVKDQRYWFSKIIINGDDLKSLETEFPDNYKNQLSIFFDASKVGSGEWLDSKVIDAQISLLNMFEEFSLRVNYSGTINHSALRSVHAPFVDIVERNAVALIFIRDILIGNPTYTATLTLYRAWKEGVKKSNAIRNLEKQGLITHERMEAVLRRQRENAIR